MRPARHALFAWFLVLAGACATPAPSFKLDGVATWRGNATAAYSIVHDDLCAQRVQGIFTHAAPELDRRGLRAGFGAIAGECEEKQLWPQVKALMARGHDLFSHSLDHPCMTADDKLAGGCDPAAPRSTDFVRQIDRAAALLDAHGIGRDFFIFPYDVCDPGAVAWLRQRGYLGARCGGHAVNAPAFTDSFAIQYDVWGPAYSAYGKAAVCQGVVPFETPPAQAPPACRAHVLKQLVDDAVAQGGWTVRVFHGFEGDPGVWEALPLGDYTAHLDDVRARADAGALWVAGPTPVLRYRWARQLCTAPQVRRNTLTFGAPSPACTRHATPVTYLVSTTDGSDPPALAAYQSGVRYPARRLGRGVFAVDADPTGGNVALMPF
jgi:peptidoglycan/xylan/chitin deacetylase (PgdA/CDA1 family)